MSQLIEYLSAYKKYSNNKYYYHNFVYDFDPASLNLDQFDVVMMAHNFWPMNLTPAQKSALAKTRALKVLFLQDEYQFVRPINAVMDEIGVDLMFTCVAEKDFDVFYPSKLIKSLKGVYGVLTGYVSDPMMAPGVFQLENKKFDVGFRSRVSPYFLGTIGYEKFRVAQKFGAFAEQSGLRTNISVNEEDRLSGPAWMQFLQNCGTQLGTPSGSSIVDFDGSVLKGVASYRRAFPRATYEEVFEKILNKYDGKHVIDTVSPRTFECAATGSTMVNLSGYYGGIIEPGRHYIELKSDYSNMSDVADQIRDKALCSKIAKTAYDDLVNSEQYHFRNFVERIDRIFDQHLPSRPTSNGNIDEGVFYNDLIERHDQSFSLDENGISYFQTPKARQLQSHDKKNDQLRRIPLLRSVLLRAGGEPHKKVRKGSAALRIAASRPLYRSLLMKALSLNAESLKFEQVLKDILLLNIIKASQSGLCFTNPTFGARLKLENGDIVLAGDPVFSSLDEGAVLAGGEDKKSAIVEPEIAAKLVLENARIVIDLTKVFPLTDFSNCILFFWPLAGEEHVFRSAPDLYFHLSGLGQLKDKYPIHVARTVLDALTPGSEKEQRLMKRLFAGMTM